MPLWVPSFKIRRSNKVLSFAVRQNNSLLEECGELCYLLQRKARANTVFQFDSRKVDYISKTAASGSYDTDPDTGNLRYLLWSEASSDPKEYPDIGTATVTVQETGGTNVWEAAVDKYSFIVGRREFAFDIYQDQLTSGGADVPDSVYVVFNTPPFDLSFTALFSFGNINPLVNFAGMQPVRSNQAGFAESLFGFEQWTSSKPKIRRKYTPNAFLLAFPGVTSDFTITEGGLLQETRGDFWTVPPPYSPAVVEHDVVVRLSTSMRYQIVDHTPIYIENILVSQHFNAQELDPRSSIYNIAITTGV